MSRVTLTRSGLRNVPGLLPGLWLGCAAAFLPLVEFLVRGQMGDRIGSATVTALWLAGTLAVLMGTGVAVRGGKAALWAVLLAGVSAVSACANLRPLLSIPALSLLMTGLTVFALSSSVKPEPTRSRLVFGLLAGGALASAYALWQRFGGLASLAPQAAEMLAANPAMAAEVRARLEEGRAFAFFLYPNALGGFLALSIPAALERWRAARAEKSQAGHLGYGILLILLASGLFSSGSIGAIASLALAFAVVALLRGGKRGKPVAVAMVAVLLLAAAIVLARPSTAVPGGLFSKATHWKSAVISWRGPVALVLGKGPGSYGEAIGRNMPPEARARFAHNWLVEAFGESGLAGLAVLCGLLAVLLAAFRRAIREKTGWGLWAGWLAMTIHMMVDIDYALPSLVYPWWAVTGMLAATALKAGSGRGKAINILPIVPAAFISLAIFVMPLFKGAPSALVLGAILGLSAAFILWKALSAGSIREWLARGDLPLLVLLGAGILWVGMSPGPARTYPSVLEGIGLLALLLLARRVAKNGGWSSQLPEWTVMATAALHGVWAIAEALATGKPAFTTFPSPNFLGAFLLAGFGMSVWGAFESGGWKRNVLILAAVSSACGIIATHSSGASLAAGMLAVIILVARGMRPKANRFRWWSGALALFLGMAIIAIPPINPISMTQRMTIWKEGMLALRENPFGWGPGRYTAAAARVRQPSYTFAGIARYSLRADFAHCEPLQAAVEWGIPAFGLILWAAWSFFRMAGRGGASWGVGLMGILLHSLVDFPFRAPPVQVLVAVSLAMFVSSVHSFWAIVRTRGIHMIPLVPVAICAWIFVSFIRVPAVRCIALPLERKTLIETGLPRSIEAADSMLAAFPLSLDGHLLNMQVSPVRYSSNFGRESRSYGDQKINAMVQEGAIRTESHLREGVVLTGGNPFALQLLGQHLMYMQVVFKDARYGHEAAAILGEAVEKSPTDIMPRYLRASALLDAGEFGESRGAIASALRIEPFFLQLYTLRGKLERKTGNIAAARAAEIKAEHLYSILKDRKGMNYIERLWLLYDLRRQKVPDLPR